MSKPIDLSPSGPPNIVLPPLDPIVGARLADATDRVSIASIVADHPDCLDAWAALGEDREVSAASIADIVDAYAGFRIGYHRGLDSLRKNGWRGSGYVRWSDDSNRGFLRCLDGLRRMAERIGEDDEQTRCAEFLRQLDPDWPPEGR